LCGVVATITLPNLPNLDQGVLSTTIYIRLSAPALDAVTITLNGVGLEVQHNGTTNKLYADCTVQAS
jgi:hypothetical protein